MQLRVKPLLMVHRRRPREKGRERFGIQRTSILRIGCQSESGPSSRRECESVTRHFCVVHKALWWLMIMPFESRAHQLHRSRSPRMTNRGATDPGIRPTVQRRERSELRRVGAAHYSSAGHSASCPALVSGLSADAYTLDMLILVPFSG